MAITNFAHKSIASFLNEHNYYIPDYQREYSWDENELEDLWMDLQNLVSGNNSKTHFFGQIVVHNAHDEEYKKYIIDGQQRASTSIILLSVFRDLFDKINKEYGILSAKNKVEDIRIKFIGRWSEDEDELRLHLGKIDYGFFKEFIQIGNYEISTTTPSHKRIKFAYDYYKKELTHYIEKENESQKKFQKLEIYYKNFIDNFKVMYVETDDINEAFIIFETLNARGKDLETSDLLKNHLLRISGKNLEIVKADWEKMIDSLDKVDATKFIRHLWNSTYSFCREKDLYKNLRDKVDTPSKSKEFASKLLKLSEIYSSLNAPQESSVFSQEVTQKLINLKTLKATTFYPIVLAMMQKNFEESDLLMVLKSIETLVVRNFVVAGKVANRSEVEFAKIAQSISDEVLCAIDDIDIRIREKAINNSEFLEAFKNFSYKSKPGIRYMLSEINNFMDHEVEILDSKKVHIEHIMPQATGHWKVSSEVKEEYLWKIGNLTLLGKEYNKSISNSLFSKKLDTYNKSSIKITKELVQYKTWGPKEILERQGRLATLALKVWPLVNE